MHTLLKKYVDSLVSHSSRFPFTGSTITSYLVFFSLEQSSLAGKFSTYKHSDVFHVLVKEFSKCAVRRDFQKENNGVLKIEVNKDVGGRQSLGLVK